jgi:hypothetical protein
MNRNIRCVLAYLNNRADRFHRFVWEYGKKIHEGISTNLSQGEMKYFKKYIGNIDTYN